MKTFQKYHLYEIFYYCNYSELKKLLFINKKYTSVFESSVFQFSNLSKKLTNKAELYEGNFADLFSFQYTKESQLSIEIGTFEYWKQRIEKMKERDEDGFIVDFETDDNCIDSDFDEMMFQSIKKIRSQIHSFKVYCPTKCLTTFKQFTSLEKFIIPYDMLSSTFVTLQQRKPPMYFQKIPISYCCIVNVPIPIPQEVIIFFSILDYHAKKVIIPSQLTYTQQVLDEMKQHSQYLFYIHQIIPPQLINILPENVILEKTIVNRLSQTFAGYQQDFIPFTKKYFPKSVYGKHITSLHSTQHLILQGSFITIIDPKQLLSLQFKEEKTKNLLMYDFSEFCELTSLSLSAENIIPRQVIIPMKLKELTLDCFISSTQTITSFPTTLTSLTLRQLSDTDLHLPTSLHRLDLRWFNNCTCIDNLMECTQLTECDIRGFAVEHLSFPYSLMKLTLSSCHYLESIFDYDYIFDLQPTITDCPCITFY